MPVSIERLHQGCSMLLESTDFPELGRKHQGKVRDSYVRNDGTRVLIVTDRVSAFDRVLGALPFKGQVLNSVAAWWFEQTKALVPNHMLCVPDPNAMLAKECTPLEVEFVVRAYLTGITSTSIWHHYEKGARTFCGHALPNGLRKHQRLPQPILTPSTKAQDGQHDVSASREEILAMGCVNERDFDAAADYAMRLFRFGQEVCAKRGLILVDTKYEFGKTQQGEVVLIDEVHTPDSSRFWFAKSYEERFLKHLDPESFDKEYVRRWLNERGYRGDGAPPEIPNEVRIEASRRYIEACETILGKEFVPNMEAPLPRIRRSLELHS